MKDNDSEIKQIEIRLKIIYQETRLILPKKDTLNNSQSKSKLNNVSNSTFDLLSQNQSDDNNRNKINGPKVKFKTDFLEIIDIQCWKNVKDKNNICQEHIKDKIKCKCIVF